MAWLVDGGGGGAQSLCCILVIGEAALAADLLTRLIFEHLERNLAAQKPQVVRKFHGPSAVPVRSPGPGPGQD